MTQNEFRFIFIISSSTKAYQKRFALQCGFVVKMGSGPQTTYDFTCDEVVGYIQARV